MTTDVDTLSTRMIRDIQRRRLTTGDRYMTATEAGRRFGVRKSTANQALQVLSERGTLLRKQRLGCVIRDVPVAGETAALTLRVLMPHGIMVNSDVPMDALCRGLLDRLPEATVAVNYLPLRHERSDLATLVFGPTQVPGDEVYLAISCGEAVYGLLTEAGARATVLGSVRQTDGDLTAIDLDYLEAGAELGAAAIAGGCTQIVAVAFAGLSGSERFVDGVCRALAEAGRPASDLRLRAAPEGQAETDAMLAATVAAADPGVAYVCATAALARRLRELAPEALIHHSTFFGGPIPGTHSLARPAWTFSELLDSLAGRLQTLGGYGTEPLESIRIPVSTTIETSVHA